MTSDRDRALVSAEQFFTVAIQLALVIYVLHQYKLVNAAFREVAALAAIGFAVHSFLPRPLRLPFFLVLCLASIVLVVGWAAGLVLIGIGLVLIAICHLPLPLPFRAALLVVVAAALVWGRSRISRDDVANTFRLYGLMPLLASMFMFRLIAFLHDRPRVKNRSLAGTLSYFFLLPNICFPLFPVVDYTRFSDQYYDEEAFKIYQRGVSFILLGIGHLLLYRFIKYHLLVDFAEVRSVTDLVRSLVFGYLLYLRISGDFHIIVGLLHLFGFNLPPAHHHVFFQEGFVGLSRGMNTYWKDFMTKVAFFPAVTWLRRRGLSVRAQLVLGGLTVVIVTWVLHLYQWFWLRGSFGISATNATFFGTVGALGMIEIGQRRRSRPGPVGRVLRIAGTFALMSVIWSIWNCESLAEWYGVVAGALAHG